ncbi:hypothetical protein [Methylobacterium platani]|uniref:Uncharacterized protein n=1 Tax=Methylobacterium platani TaxID=427683 RepID=A0A179SAS3_9HYPH|nr:hypothetical protein [Methylobacterium platani]OAS23958.1 hypothetical protein A5481_16050 [Methylobacterium platani]
MAAPPRAIPGAMRVAFHPVPEHPDAVGTLDGAPLVVVGRELRVGGQTVPLEEAGEALATAVEGAATALWGGDYLGSLARVLDMNRRSVVSDRIARNGLPAWALAILGHGTGHPRPRALGYLLLAAAELIDDAGETPAAFRGADCAGLARQDLENALALVARARDQKILPGRTG